MVKNAPTILFFPLQMAFAINICLSASFHWSLHFSLIAEFARYYYYLLSPVWVEQHTHASLPCLPHPCGVGYDFFAMGEHANCLDGQLQPKYHRRLKYWSGKHFLHSPLSFSPVANEAIRLTALRLGGLDLTGLSPRSFIPSSFRFFMQ